jgi:(E)-4-hydroxy-3-methylbut-2-enyl-diphosphate synthase
MYHAGKKTGKTDNDVMVDEIVEAVEKRAGELG